jgi:isoleucyl-tRNA synthetase
VISRQRAWGVPIAVFVRENGDGSVEILRTRRSTSASARPSRPKARTPGMRLARASASSAALRTSRGRRSTTSSTSGSTQARRTPSTLEDPRHFPSLAGIKRRKDGGDDTVMY